MRSNLSPLQRVRWFQRVACLSAAGLCLLAAGSVHAQGGGSASVARLRGSVTDSASGQPIAVAEVRLLRAGRAVHTGTTSALGRYALHVSEAGRYDVEVSRMGFGAVRLPVLFAEGDVVLDVVLTPVPEALDTLVGNGTPMVTVDTRTGDQVFQRSTYHGSPATTTTQIVQQALSGAARAPTGEVHIRGQHGEFTYRLDGLPVPPGISGSLSELFSLAVVSRIEFQTGGWDAEFGNRNTAVIKVDTRVPAGGLRVRGSINAGSFGTAGQSLLASGNAGKLGVVVSGARQVSGMRREPVMQAKDTREGLNFHNSGEDLYSFGKLQYMGGERDLLTMDIAGSRTNFEVPFDSTGGVLLDDRQRERNAFVNFGWRHALGDNTSDGELFVGVYHRSSRLVYAPGVDQAPPFVFYPDTVHYNLSEDRRARTTGIELDALLPQFGVLQVKTGLDASIVRGNENFATRDSKAMPGPTVTADVRGGDVGVYVQGSVKPSRWWELRPGVRYDAHIAPLAGHAVQLSPRLRLNLFPGERSMMWLYYGRLFVPSTVEDFHVLASAGQEGQSGNATFPERDHFFEAGMVQRIPSVGVTLKLDAYHKRSSPAVDDNTLPGTAFSATVNVAEVRVTGIESVVEFRPGGALSGYLNVALSHARAHGPITGGFSLAAYPDGWYDMDHDQRLSAAGSLSYDRRRWYASVTGIYGSGLTNGDPSAGLTKLGLFDFNRAVKVKPSAIFNTSVGGTLRVLNCSVRPQLSVDNVFDHAYVLKGAFTSGRAVGRPRSLQVRVDIET